MSIEPDASQATGRGSIPMDSFGNRLMLARAHAGHISIREAADLCGIGRGAWTNWEKGARPADIIEEAEIIADKLGVNREWLLFGGPLPKAEPRRQRVTERYRSLADRVAASSASAIGTIRDAVNRPPGRRDPAGPGRTVRIPRPPLTMFG